MHSKSKANEMREGATNFWARFWTDMKWAKEHLRTAKELSAEWQTCACATLCKDKNKEYFSQDNEPLDMGLYSLGIDFHKHVYDMAYAYEWNPDGNLGFEHYYSGAREIWEEIEKRWQEILEGEPQIQRPDARWIELPTKD